MSELSPSKRIVCRAVRISATAMWFCVNVPVLSVHSRVAAPRVSMAEARRVSTRSRDSRQAPIAVKTASTRGNSSGTIDMPSAIPASSASSQEPRDRPNSSTVMAQHTSPSTATVRTIARVSSVRRGVAVSMPARARPIWPMRLRGAGGDHFGHAAAAHHQGAGIDGWLVFAAGIGMGRFAGLRGALAHRHGFAGQQRLVGLKIVGGAQHRVGRNAVAFRKQDDVAAHHLAARNAPVGTVADHQGARAGQVPQGFQHALGPAFLDDGDADRGAGKEEKEQRLFQASQQQVDDTGAQQQREHRLADGGGSDLWQAAAFLLRQLVGAFGRQPRLGLLTGQSARRRIDHRA